MTILVLIGGTSEEREVSLRSGKAVMVALRRAGYQVSSYDPKSGTEGLERALKQADVVLPILHGGEGENGEIQKQLEDAGIPYLGATSDVSQVTIDKIKTHKALEAIGIKMPKYEEVNRTSYHASKLARAAHVLKPIDGGSSIDALVVREPSERTAKKAAELLDRYPSMLLEEYIEGIELTVAVIGNNAMPVVASIPPPNEEYSYENKYNGRSQELCPVPTQLAPHKQQVAARQIAEKAHKQLGVRHLSRTDMILDSDGELYVLEVNTMPGLTEQSSLPSAANASGITMTELVKRFVQMASEP